MFDITCSQKKLAALAISALALAACGGEDAAPGDTGTTTGPGTGGSQGSGGTGSGTGATGGSGATGGTGATGGSGQTGAVKATATPEEGATLTSADGRLRIVVPPGAVTEPTEISAEAVPAAEATADFPDAVPAGVVYELGPDGQQFAKPVQLTLTLDMAEVTTTGNGVPAMAILSRSANGPDELLNASAVAGAPLAEPAPVTLADFAASEVLVSGDTTHFSRAWGVISDGGFGDDNALGVAVAPQEIEACVGEEFTVTYTVYNNSPSATTQVDWLTSTTLCSVVQEVGDTGCDPFSKYQPAELLPGALADFARQFVCVASGLGDATLSAVTADKHPVAWAIVDVTCVDCPPPPEGAWYLALLGPPASPLESTVNPTTGKQVSVGETYDAGAFAAQITIVDLATPDSPKQVVVPDIQPHAAVPLDDGSVALGGTTAAYAPWVGLLDANGALSWQAGLAAGGEVTSVAPQGSGELLALQDRYDGPMHITRLTTAGAVVEELTIDTPFDSEPTAILSHSAGGFFLTGSIPNGANRDGLVMRFDAAGAILWQKSFSTGGFPLLGAAAEAADGGLLLQVAPDFFVDPQLWRLGPDGSVIWQNTYATFYVNSAVAAPQGIRVLGELNGLNGDLAALELGDDGAVLGAKTYADTGSTSSWSPFGIATLPDGRVAIGAGNTTSWLSVLAASDLTVFCGDAAMGATAPTAGIVVTSSPVTLVDTSFTATTGTGAASAGSAPGASPATVTSTNLCFN